MSRNKRKRFDVPGRITSGGNLQVPGQKGPNVIILTQPKRFGIDIADFTSAVRAAENVDWPRRTALYDLYEDILIDSHLSSVVDKRRSSLLRTAVEFRRDGAPDDAVNKQIRSPWFRRMLSDILDAQFWGFSLLQFYKEGKWINYDLVPRKHVDPVRREILHRQTDLTGTSWDEYPGLLFVGAPRELGLFLKTAPWVIYKRNGIGDWSQFSEVFGMPIQEYTYDTDDDDSRQRAIDDAANAGSLAVFVHGKDTSLNLLEAGNKTGSADVWERLGNFCNKEISKVILLNTLTTETSSTGTQALGTVHKKSEDSVLQSDRQFILDVLNYDMADIFLSLGIDTRGGEFSYPEKKDIDPTAKVNIVTQLRNGFNLPIGDDWLYNEFGIEKPDEYDAIKRKQEEEAQAAREKEEMMAAASLVSQDERDDDDPKGEEPGKEPPAHGGKKSFAARLRDFFARAPRSGGADLDW